jgi:hypothetical protein
MPKCKTARRTESNEIDYKIGSGPKSIWVGAQSEHSLIFNIHCLKPVTRYDIFAQL